MDKGVVCNYCHVRLGSQEKPIVSRSGLAYHAKCFNSVFGEKTNCHVKEVPIPEKRQPPRQGYFRFRM